MNFIKNRLGILIAVKRVSLRKSRTIKKDKFNNLKRSA